MMMKVIKKLPCCVPVKEFLTGGDIFAEGHRTIVRCGVDKRVTSTDKSL